MPQGDLAVEVHAGETVQVALKFKNTGAYAWRGTGKAYVSLYATGPYKRKSAFRDASWTSTRQPARLREAAVAPGKVGSVTFTLRAPVDPGTYVEQFQLAVENVAWIHGSVARVRLTVLPERIAADMPVNAKAFQVTDAETGESLLEQDATAPRSIASITKLMTVMVARESGLDPKKVVALQRADEVGGGRLRVPVGTKLAVHELVASTIVGSANNAANALARATGLSKEEFVARMNAKAAALGLASTAFADPTGIEVGNVSTAREVALMAKAAFDDPWIAEFAAAPTYQVATSRGLHDIRNTNRLVRDEAVEVLGGKTGFIHEAGYTLVTRLRKPGRRDLIVAVLGGDAERLPARDTKILAERAWQAIEQASLTAKL
jgi:D-alanyl-D-alanine endopeptidase (penicillin-binding protein 7)